MNGKSTLDNMICRLLGKYILRRRTSVRNVSKSFLHFFTVFTLHYYTIVSLETPTQLTLANHQFPFIYFKSSLHGGFLGEGFRKELFFLLSYAALYFCHRKPHRQPLFSTSPSPRLCGVFLRILLHINHYFVHISKQLSDLSKWKIVCVQDSKRKTAKEWFFSLNLSPTRGNKIIMEYNNNKA